MLQEFKSILDLIKAFPTEQDCIDHLAQLRWNGNVVSPFDETSQRFNLILANVSDKRLTYENLISKV